MRLNVRSGWVHPSLWRRISGWIYKGVIACCVIIVFPLAVKSQCNTLRPQIDISFNTDQDCAPVTVTEFRITYYFNVPQDPSTIQILYEWNDPANSTTIIGTGTGLIVGASGSGPNTAFTANATFLYTDNDDQCNITPTTYIVIGGTICATSQQVQTAFYWDTDNEANGVVQMDPEEWEVCYNNPVVNAVFEDASEFNCNIMVEPDNPNQFARHVQFVYGTNHNPASTIRDLTLNDGAIQNLTDGSGNLSTSDTRGTGAIQITGAYFGPVDEIPFPANGPVSVTFPMNAPANPANAIGNRFEITMFNWNVCNPWNGDPIDPNYEDAILTTGYIIIVEAPQPDFFTQDADGNPATDFCIGEVISFRNNTPNVTSYNHNWQFYNDAAGTDLAGTSSQRHPNFAFSSGGQKLIRLTASSPTAQGPCTEVFESFVNITPSMVAVIGVTDLADIPITPDFCQENTGALTAFNVRFHDQSTGVSTPSTGRRWEFFDENGTLVFESPSGGGFAVGVAGPFDRVFLNPGVYDVTLHIRDNVTECESIAATSVRVFEKPHPEFSATRVCEGLATDFQDMSTLSPIIGESITSREWDMSYDGVTFSKDPALDDQQTFAYTFPAAGTFTVALRVTTDQGGCSDIFTSEVVVDPIPVASFTSDQTSGCSTLDVVFTNTAVSGQPDVIDEFRWEIDDGSGFVVDGIQRPEDPEFTATYTRSFLNNGSADKEYQVRLRAVTVNGCETVSPVQTITVFPAPRAGFVSLGYSPFNDNCSPVTVSFEADAQTIALNPTEYVWTISDDAGVVSQESSGTDPSYTFEFINNSQALKDFQVRLEAVLPSGCSGDSTRVIRVSPVPNSNFSVDTVEFVCEQVTLHLEALQKGLAEYEWTIESNGVTLLNSTTVGDEFDYVITRSTTVEQAIEITLSTRNFANCESTPTVQNLTIGPRDDIGASFTATPASQKFPDATVVITNNTNPGPWEYSWDFGDGSTSTSATVQDHTYSGPGTYTITLVVSSVNCSETRTATVEITPGSPEIEFTYDPPAGCEPLTVTFTNQSVNADPATYQWDFGDGSTSTEENPVHVYGTPGVYSVTLTASNSIGESAQMKKDFIIEVYETPIAQFNIKPRQIPFPGGKLYTDNQSFGATSYLWDFGDGTTSTDFEPEHVYLEEGTYTISLTASNAAGCTDTRILEAGAQTIYSGQVLIPNAFSPNLLGPGTTGGQNDVFLPILRGVTEFQMLVFNRWGELLFETTDASQGWDGYYQGRLCQQDVYVYRITAKYANGQVITRVGDIHLMR